MTKVQSWEWWGEDAAGGLAMIAKFPTGFPHRAPPLHFNRCSIATTRIRDIQLAPLSFLSLSLSFHKINRGTKCITALCLKRLTQLGAAWHEAPLALSPLLIHCWPPPGAEWITALSHMFLDTHVACKWVQMRRHTHTRTHTHSTLEWACMHSRGAPVAHNPPLTCGQRYPFIFVRVFTPTFPTGLSSHAASLLSSTPDAPLIDFLFLWVVAHVTFPVGAHTLTLSTASHPGDRKYRKFPRGGLLHGKATSASTRHTLAWIPHCAPADKGASMELRGGEITQYVAIITPTRGEADRICVGMSTFLYFKRLCLLVEWWVTNTYIVS